MPPSPVRIERGARFARAGRASPARIERHVQSAYDLRCRYFLSVCPVEDQPPQNLSPVRPAIERRYWIHPMSEPSYVRKRFAVRSGRAVAVKRTYFLGWRRLLASR